MCILCLLSMLLLATVNLFHGDVLNCRIVWQPQTAPSHSASLLPLRPFEPPDFDFIRLLIMQVAQKNGVHKLVLVVQMSTKVLQILSLSDRGQ